MIDLSRFSGFSWNPPGGLGWLFLLLAVAAVAYAVTVYRKTDAPLTPGFRAMLTGLRALFLLVLIAVLCRPVISLAIPGGAERGVLLLLDRSLSLGLPGREPDTLRDDELRAAHQALRAELGRTYPLVERPFAADLLEPLDPQANPGELVPGGTSIADALDQGVAEGPRPGAVVLVSDGAQTRGSDPVPLGRRLGIPVSVVPLGSRDPVVDLSLVRVRANQEAFLGDETPLEAVVRLQGLEESSITVTVRDVTDSAAVELARETVSVPSGGAERRVPLRFKPERVGLRFLEVTLSGLEGEATAANNRRLVAVDVREEKNGLLLLTGKLTWDHTFLRRSLESDSTLVVHGAFWSQGAFQSVDPGKRARQLTAEGLRGIRVVVLDHVTPDQLGDRIDAVAGFVQSGGGLVMVAGSDGDALTRWRGTSLESLLPVQVAGGPSREVEVRLSSGARRHALFDPTSPGASPLEVWTGLPPVRSAPGLGELRGHGEALLVERGGNNPLPVVSWGPLGQGRVLLFAGGGFWAWSFASSSQQDLVGVVPAWWRRVAQWMSRPILETRFEAHPDQFVVGRGDGVRFIARATDSSYQPLPDVSVRVTIEGTGGDSQSVTLTGEEGFLSGRHFGLDPGRYLYRAEARTEREVVGTIEGEFAVDSLGAEMERLETDHELLSRLAQATGGTVFDPDSLTGIGARLQAVDSGEDEVEQVDLWDHPLIFALFVLFGGTEWFLRRRRGLV